ncbi:uncharacterized protein LOC143291481 [Babylonia areolata]|uniref:uncharacterized protein LOC143291481 n=1 Tax=Babylonia areolata TaxID=304850 RepID=UPI003FD3A128
MSGWVSLCLFTLSLISGSMGNGDPQCQAEIDLPKTVDIHQGYDPPLLTTVHFQVVNECPESLRPYRLSIEAFDDDHRRKDPSLGGKVVCLISPTGNLHGDCSCDDELSRCQATETFPRQPHRTWTFSDLYGRIAARTVVFNVTYPTIMKHFAIHRHEDKSSVTVNKGDTIQFNCQWSEGNPQRRILLLGPDNSTLKEVDVRDGRRNSMRRNKKNISCSNGGQYRCQVEGTEEVKSLTVLVRCPVVFRQPTLTPAQRVTPGTNARFLFSVTSYTTDVTSCQLKSPDEDIISCNSSRSDVIVTGPLPHADVIVTLKDVTERDEGTWQLTVSNPTPSEKPVTARFHLFVTNHHPDRDYFWYFWYAIGGGSALFASMIIIIIIVIVRMRKNRRKFPIAVGAAAADDRRAVPVAPSDDYLTPVARRVESAESADDTNRRAVPMASSDEYLEPVARRVVSSAHVYSEIPDIFTTTTTTPRRVPLPVPPKGSYGCLSVDEIGQRSVYSNLRSPPSLKGAHGKAGQKGKAFKKALMPKRQK